MTCAATKPARFLWAAGISFALCAPAAASEDTPGRDLLAFAAGALPVAIGGAAEETRVGLEQALQLIDGDARGFVLTPKPGGADTAIVFVYELPAPTTFEAFAVPNVLETPSPSQTFFRTVSIAGSDSGPEGPFTELGAATLSTHAAKGEWTRIPAASGQAVQWVQLTLQGGINVERDQTFFEFSEIAGFGEQEPPPLSQAFTGKWQGRGVKLELEQDGVRVSGCFDGAGELDGTVSGNLLHATGQDSKSGVPSIFVLSVGSDDGIVGVRSTNGAPFKLYRGDPAPALKLACPDRPVAPIGCGSVIHGIQFDFDSAAIRLESDAHLDALYEGLQATPAAITVIGHTSSEGSEAYNQDLSQRRAAAVAAALVARGLDAGRVAADGQGEGRPIADNDTEAGRSLNRRVEIECR